MPYTQPHQYTLMPSMQQTMPGQSRMTTTFRELEFSKFAKLSLNKFLSPLSVTPIINLPYIQIV